MGAEIRIKFDETVSDNNDRKISYLAFDAVLRWIGSGREFRQHVFDDTAYMKMIIDETYGESYKADVATIRQELKSRNDT